MDEQTRRETLHALNVLDTGENPEIDRITSLASRIFAAPIALVSLVDADRLWFHSNIGLEMDDVPREQSFCAHAICGQDVLEVTDATQDPRFQTSDLVTNPPHIRYYCGAPLVARNGASLGTLCILDSEPREGMSRGKQLLLKELAAQVVREMELKRLGVDTTEITSLLPKKG